MQTTVTKEGTKAIIKLSGRFDFNARRAPIDHATQSDPVALTKGRDAEHMAECVERHGERRLVELRLF